MQERWSWVVHLAREASPEEEAPDYRKENGKRGDSRHALIEKRENHQREAGGTMHIARFWDVFYLFFKAHQRGRNLWTSVRRLRNFELFEL